MDIERLKDLKQQIRGSHDGINGDDLNLLYDLLPLIDEAIARQSVTDEDVRKAIHSIKEHIQLHRLRNYPQLNIGQALDLAIQALQQMQKAQELEKENQGLKKIIEDMQRNLDAWNPRQSFNEPTTGNPMPQTSYTTSINKTDLADGKLR